MATKILDKNKLTLKAQTAPEVIYKYDSIRGYVSWGKNNKFPNELIEWFNNHAEHGAIVKGKARYLSGLEIETDNELAERWLIKANPKESWFDVSKLIDKSKVLFGAYALKVVPNLIGTPLQYYHIEFGNIRFSPCGKYVFVIHRHGKWNEVKRKYPVWYKGCKEIAIYIYKDNNPNVNEFGNLYPEPEYFSCTQDIDTDVRITTFFNQYVKNNWSSGQIINISGAEGTIEEKDAIAESLLEEKTGEENGGKPTIIFSERDSKGAEVLSLNASDLDKQYQELSKRNQQKILTGHNVNGALFKILVEGKLGDRNEIDLAHELFISEYVTVEQKLKLDTLSELFECFSGQVAEFWIKQVKGVNRPLPLENQTVVASLNSKSPEIIYNYIVDYYGIDIPDDLTINPVGNNISIEQGTANEALNSLSRRQTANLIAVVKDYNKGKTTKEQAMILLKGFGLSDSEALEFLGIAEEDGLPEIALTNITKLSEQSKKEVDFFLWFEENCHDVNEEDEIVSITPVRSIAEALQLELKNQKIHLATPLKVTVEDLRTAILEQYNANPAISLDELAANFEIDSAIVQKELEHLISKKLLVIDEDGFIPSPKGAKKVSEQYKTEIYTEYKYELAPENKGQKLLLETSHPFCKKMVGQYNNKAISLEKIDKIKNDFGMNAFDYRGGFTMTKSGIIEPTCRHIWNGYTRMRKTKIN